jgi:hypothetical protein
MAAPATVAEAKRDLLEWGVRADAELHEQVTTSLSAVKQGAKGLIPWATLGATGIGLLMRLVRGRGGGSGKAKPKSKGSLLGMVLRGAMDVWPIVSVMMQSRKGRERT